MTVEDKIRSHYDEPGRHYHTFAHVEAVLDHLGGNISDELRLAALFHDIVYDPLSKTNEEDSCRVFRSMADEWGLEVDRARVETLIMATKDHFRDWKDPDCAALVDADMGVFDHAEQLFAFERGIFLEYQRLPLGEYLTGRKAFLEKVSRHFGVHTVRGRNAEVLKDIVRSKVYRIGIYAGSFNPFHIGHEDICLQAEAVFDKVIIAQGFNRDKVRPPQMKTRRRQLISYDGLLSDLFAPEEHCSKYLIRGLRNSFDVAYEDSLRNTLMDMRPDIDIVYFFCAKKHEHISSSMIRSLYQFGPEAYERYLAQG